MSPDKVFQEMNNYWSSCQSGSQSEHVFAKTLIKKSQNSGKNSYGSWIQMKEL